MTTPAAAPEILTAARVIASIESAREHARSELDRAAKAFREVAAHPAATPADLVLMVMENGSNLAEARAKVESFDAALGIFDGDGPLAVRIAKLARAARAMLRRLADDRICESGMSDQVRRGVEYAVHNGRARAWGRISEEAEYLIEAIASGEHAIPEGE